MSDQELLKFVKETKWDQYITDSKVQENLKALKERVATLQKSATSSTPTTDAKPDEQDLSTATRVKLVVVGDGAVGKTSLLISFSTGEFPTDYLPTVFENYTAQMKRDGLILLHLWDTAGQEDYDRLRPLSYPGTDIVLLCFSTISKASFDAVKEKWAPEISHYIPSCPKFLIGTKIDLREAKHPDPNTNVFNPIEPAMGTALAKELGCDKYMEVSSKTREGLLDIFNAAVDTVQGQRGVTPGSKSKGNDSQGVKKQKKGGCIMV